MRYFSTPSATITTVRREGFYPSKRTAAFVAERVGFVLELTNNQIWALAQYFVGNHLDERLDDMLRLTPAEMQVCESFLSWYSLDYDGSEAQKAFVCHNLNSGKSLVIISKSDVRTTISTLPIRAVPSQGEPL